MRKREAIPISKSREIGPTTRGTLFLPEGRIGNGLEISRACTACVRVHIYSYIVYGIIAAICQCWTKAREFCSTPVVPGSRRDIPRWKRQSANGETSGFCQKQPVRVSLPLVRACAHTSHARTPACCLTALLPLWLKKHGHVIRGLVSTRSGKEVGVPCTYIVSTSTPQQRVHPLPLAHASFPHLPPSSCNYAARSRGLLLLPGTYSDVFAMDLSRGETERANCLYVWIKVFSAKHIQ